jgi:hypothetical protein
MQFKKVALIGTAIAAVFFAGVSVGAQPNMQKALESLQDAKASLQKADDDKGGHKVVAAKLIDEAIDHVKAGIDYAKTH